MYEINEICEKCQKKKIMYYREYCPRCDEPKMKIIYSYNLLECLYFIESTSHPGFKDKFWDYLLNHYNVVNDTTIEIFNNPENDLVKELFEKMEIEDNKMSFEISW